MIHWSDKYIGIPFDYMNCGDLAVYVYRTELMGTVKMPEKPAQDNVFAYSSAVESQIMKYVDCETQFPQDGDLILMRACNRLAHVGVLCKISNTSYVLHSSDVFGASVRCRLTDLERQGYKVEAYYKWRK